MKYKYNRYAPTAVAVLLCIAMVCLSGVARAQDEYVVRVTQVQTDAYPEITLYVDIKDKSGQRVTNLQQADFTVTEDDQPVEVVDFAGVGDERPVDIVFVFDTTSSMREEVNGVKDTSIRFAQELEDKGRDYRLGLVTFGDKVRDARGTGGKLTDDAREFKQWIERIRVQGGGEGPENDFGALKRASQMSFRTDAQRVFVLITDAPPHYYRDSPDEGVTFDDRDLDPGRILNILAEQTITVYAVTYNHPDFHRLAGETGGDFYDIAREPNFTRIIEQIGAAIATQYRLTYRSPRPSYDGTRRDIRVLVGVGTEVESSGGGEYLEKHLLNIQSSPLVGTICLLPLLIILMAPTGLRLVKGMRQASPLPTPIAPPSHTPPAGQPEMRQSPLTPSFASPTCPHCGHSLRPRAKFCPSCGQSTLASPSPQRAAPTCPNCGNAVRSGAKFCTQCRCLLGER